MHVVTADDAWDIFNIFLDVLDIDMVRGSLEQDLSRCRCQGDGGPEDDQGDEERYNRIRIVFTRPVGEPNDEGGYDDTDVSEGVSNYVKNHSVHTHVTMAMAMTTLCLLGLVVVMTSMRRVASRLPRSRRISVAMWLAIGFAKQRGALSGRVFLDSLYFRFCIITTLNSIELRPARCNYFLPEAGRVDTKIINVVSRMSARRYDARRSG